MVKCHARRILVYVILLAYKMRSACCSPDQQFFAMLSNYFRPPLNDMNHLLTMPTQRIAKMWNDVYDAIQRFILEYQTQHAVLIDLVYTLENTQPYEMGHGKLEGIFRLRFSRKSSSGEDTQQSVLLKVPWLGALFVEGQNLSLYIKEKCMYERILPLMQNQTLPHVYFSPLAYGFTHRGTVVVEDLQETGFHVELKLHDEILCHTVLQLMAQFHAYSLTRVDQASTEALDALTVKNRDFLATDPISVTAVNKFRKHVLPQLPEDVKLDLQDMDSEFLTATSSGYAPNLEGLNVILHGDLRQETVFFSANPEARTCKFVDFHNSRLGSPALDLIGYLMSSVAFDVVEASGKELLMFYLAEFERNLRESTIEEPGEDVLYSMDDLCADMRRHKWFIIFRLITIVPRSWGRQHKFISNASEDYYDFLFRNLKYVSVFKGWWRFLNHCDISAS